MPLSVALDDTHRHSESLGSLVPSREDEVARPE